MININVDLEPQTEKKIKRIFERYSDKKTFFKDIIEHEISDLKNGIVNTQIDLKKFEQKYKQNSEDFYREFAQGKLEDEDDFMIWSGIYEMQQDNIRKLAELE